MFCLVKFKRFLEEKNENISLKTIQTRPIFPCDVCYLLFTVCIVLFSLILSLLVYVSAHAFFIFSPQTRGKLE